MSYQRNERPMSLNSAQEAELRERPGGSNIGKYSHVKETNFAGEECGLPGAYPIDTIERARSALKLAHNATNKECIIEQVYKKYPSLREESK